MRWTLKLMSHLKHAFVSNTSFSKKKSAILKTYSSKITETKLVSHFILSNFVSYAFNLKFEKKNVLNNLAPELSSEQTADVAV